MLTNPLLDSMSLADLDRRYAGSMVRYNGEMALIQNFNEGPERGFTRTTSTGDIYEIFRSSLLDVSRPPARWVTVGNKFYYISYKWNRQWHRGFCEENTVIRGPRGDQQPVGRWSSFEILKALYESPCSRFRTSVEEVDSLFSSGKIKGIVLSPQVLICKFATHIPMVFFRELYIGRLGAVYPLFVQEVKELIGDYVNEDPAPDTPSIKGTAKSYAPDPFDRGDFGAEVLNDDDRFGVEELELGNQD